MAGGGMGSSSLKLGTYPLPNSSDTYTLYSTLDTWEVVDPGKHLSTQGSTLKARSAGVALAQLLDGRVAVMGGAPDEVRIYSYEHRVQW
jgi:hypothetical protein